MFVARQSSNIQSDIARNWSSWNFGQDGFNGTYDELQDYLSSCDDDSPICISGLELYPRDIKRHQFGELYENYWVVIDNENASGGLSCINLNADTLDQAVIESQSACYFGDGDCFDANNAVLVYTENDIHIFEIAD